VVLSQVTLQVPPLTVILEGVRSALRGMPEACYLHEMANLQVKDVPEDIHRQLRECARRRGKSLRELVLEALGKELSYDEFERRLRRRSRVQLSGPAGGVLAEVRAERER
jgi:hypothetical protein